jgi:hypothetical protein
LRSTRNANTTGTAYSDIEEQVIDKVIDLGYCSASSSSKHTNSHGMSSTSLPTSCVKERVSEENNATSFTRCRAPLKEEEKKRKKINFVEENKNV